MAGKSPQQARAESAGGSRCRGRQGKKDVRSLFRDLIHFFFSSRYATVQHLNVFHHRVVNAELFCSLPSLWAPKLCSSACSSRNIPGVWMHMCALNPIPSAMEDRAARGGGQPLLLLAAARPLCCFGFVPPPGKAKPEEAQVHLLPCGALACDCRVVTLLFSPTLSENSHRDVSGSQTHL